MINHRSLIQCLAIFLLFFLIFAGTTTNSYAQNLYINLIAVNGSEDAKQTPVKYYLPTELKPEDVVNSGDLKINFDVDKSQYYVSGDFTLQPKESKTFKIEVKDVWKIDPDSIDVIKEQLDKNLNSLKNSPSYDSALILRNAMVDKLDYIVKRQEQFSTDVGRRIEEYRSNLETFNVIKQNALNLEYLQSATVDAEKEGVVKMVLEVANPDPDNSKKITQKHYLPAEIRSMDILDAQGFDVRYDEEKKQSFLAKEEEFAPGEKKRYVILLKNTWYFPKPDIDSLQTRTKNAIDGIVKFKEGQPYEKSARFLADKILATLNEITTSQSIKRDVKDGIGVYRVNKVRYQDADQALKELERLLAIVSAQRLKRLEDLDKNKVTNILQKIQALRGISALSKVLLGTRPKVTTTWRIIWGTLIFVAFFTSIHFFTWRARSKYMGEEHAAGTQGELKDVGSPEDDKEESKKTK